MTARIAIMASGSGTTAEAFIRNSLLQQLDQRVELIIVSRRDAGIIARLVRLNKELGLAIPCVIINSFTHHVADGEAVRKGHQTKAEEQAIMQALADSHIDIVVLLGYMKRIGPELVVAYGWRPKYTSPYQARMINSHPGPLPATMALYGENVQQHILNQGLAQGCQTLHLVAEDYDDGPILAEHWVDVTQNDTAVSLFARIQIVEKQHIAADIDAFYQERQQYLAADASKQEVRV